MTAWCERLSQWLEPQGVLASTGRIIPIAAGKPDLTAERSREDQSHVFAKASGPGAWWSSGAR